MNSGLIRWLDRNIGRPLCFIFTSHRRLVDSMSRRRLEEKRPSRILFIKLIEQGSTVLAWDAMKKAEELVGRKNIYFMVFHENIPILKVLDIVPEENIIEIDGRATLNFIFSAIKALMFCRKKGIDSVVDLEGFSRASAIIAYLSGASMRSGFHMYGAESPYRGDLMTHRMIYNSYIHTRLRFLSLVEAFRWKVPEGNRPMSFKVPEACVEQPVFHPDTEEKKKMAAAIGDYGDRGPDRPVVILNPNISDLLPARRWPKDYFVTLGQMIADEYPEATIVLTGTAGEKEATDEVAGKIDGAISLAGKTTIRDLLTLYSISDLLVTNDSGPSHFSSLTQVKRLILFGPETPVLYGERHEKALVISPGSVCSPCVSVLNNRVSPCSECVCLAGTSPEDIMCEVRRLLGDRHSDHGMGERV